MAKKLVQNGEKPIEIESYYKQLQISTTLKVKIFVQWPFGDQLFGFSRQGKFLGAKLY